MIIPEKIEQQDEIQKIEILEFYARKRIIGIATILNELTTNYLNGNSVWKQQPTTRAIRKNFISPEIMTNYCKAIGHRYPDHQCSKCYGEDNVIPAIQLE
ncbi:hypothetical protein H5410_056853 [Solanum commersonii]|uniref:Uncharacterized protein n=1 Tax=Solanum commersonii TaxID=4109 RepID=A0A9J5WNG1_SOLCO|nr:hypothetical protein H5410_056853 [Solanum commersonii]